MEETRQCSACGIDLVGPFLPKILLTTSRGDRPGDAREAIQVAAYGWFCPTCGLLHWYAESESLAQLNAVPMSEPEPEVSPDSNYERRKQMLRLMQHIRRM